MKAILRIFGLSLILLASAGLALQPARAQSGQPLALVMTADGPIMPPMLDYIRRGIAVADQRNAEVLIIQLNTPGGLINTMKSIVEVVRSSNVPVIVFVSPRGAWAGSAGALVTMSGHASAMAPETVIGFASPVGSSGEDLDETMKAKETEALTSIARTLTEQRGAEAVALAEAMIIEAKAVTNQEALEVGFVDFVVDNVDDLLEALDGFTVEMNDGPRTLDTARAHAEPLNMSFIEQLLMFLTDPNIVFAFFSLGITCIIIEISSPGGWVAGFIGVICLSLSVYGIGALTLNWFGIIFLVTAFVLFALEIKTPTYGALTVAGVASFIVGALVLFNSPGTPQFQRVSVPLVIGVSASIGLLFVGILMFALRALRVPVSSGVESYVGKTGTARTWSEAGGQVQLASELWTAEKSSDSESIRKGDPVEVVEVKGLRLKVRKKQ